MEPTTHTRHEAARKAARARWGPPRHVNLGDLTPDQRRVVLAFVDMARASAQKETSAVSETPAEVDAEGHANDRAAA